MSNIELINETGFSLDDEAFQDVFDVFILQGLLKSEQYCCLKLVDNNQVTEFNRKYRGKNKKTDVLTFPSEFKEIPFLGDIIIDVSTAEEQKGDHSLMSELKELLIHGILHLLGYDHLKSSEQREMLDLEDKIKKLLFKEI